jgi:hypothetical protein
MLYAEKYKNICLHKNKIFEMEKQFWGYHLILDCAELECEPSILKKQSYIQAFVDEIIHTLHLSGCRETLVEVLENSCSNELSGYRVVQLTNSCNFCFYVCDVEKTIYFDIFSYKQFPEKTIISLVKKFFKPKITRETFLTRRA